MKPGGTEGGGGQFLFGCVLCVGAVWLFFDSVRVMSSGFGAISGAMHGGGARRGGMMETTSMGIVFVPFFIGLIALFYNAKLKWAWALFWVGLAVIVVEIVSRLRFFYDFKLTHFIIMMVMFAAGAGLILRGVMAGRELEDDERKRLAGGGGGEG